MCGERFAGRIRKRAFEQTMRAEGFLLARAGGLLLASLAAGCSPTGDGSAGQVAAPGGAPPVSVPPPVWTAAPSAAVVIPADPDVNATLRRLSLELRKHVARTRSVPRNFDEFVAQARLQVPAPPAGKRYAIANQAVVLVER